jgi:hypothetical protein
LILSVFLRIAEGSLSLSLSLSGINRKVSGQKFVPEVPSQTLIREAGGPEGNLVWAKLYIY